MQYVVYHMKNLPGFCFMQRLFFLSGEQDLSAFLLVDLGIVKYPNYNCIMSDQILSSRNDLIAYEEVSSDFFLEYYSHILHLPILTFTWQAIEVAQIMDQSLDENNTELVLRCLDISTLRMSNSSSKANHSSTSELPVTFFSCFSASWVYSKVALLGVSFLEREQRLGVCQMFAAFCDACILNYHKIISFISFLNFSLV